MAVRGSCSLDKWGPLLLWGHGAHLCRCGCSSSWLLLAGWLYVLLSARPSHAGVEAQL